MPLPYDGFDEESQLVWHFTILQTDEPGMTCPGLLNGGLFYVSERGGKIVQLQLAAGGCVKSQVLYLLAQPPVRSGVTFKPLVDRKCGVWSVYWAALRSTTGPVASL